MRGGIIASSPGPIASLRVPAFPPHASCRSIAMFTLPPLPYPDNALDPVISANTLSVHHGKHHKAYVDNLNNLVKGTDLESQSLEAITLATAGKPDKQGIFNNAAQVWNHTFFWNCLRPGGGGRPTGQLAAMIDSAFGGYDNFK
jgi:Fe-Mn family superoxide dismutase